VKVVCFLLGNSPASEFYVQIISENSVCSIFTGVKKFFTSTRLWR